MSSVRETESDRKRENENGSEPKFMQDTQRKFKAIEGVLLKLINGHISLFSFAMYLN